MTNEVDSLLPQEMAQKAEAIGVKKADLGVFTTLTLGVLAGAFIGMGAIFATVTWTGGGIPFGISRLLGGVVFSLGLILVVVGGAELFTGNNLIVMAWAGKKISLSKLLRNWGLVYIGNFIGAVGTAALVFLSEHHFMAGGQLGGKALAIGQAKCGLEFMPAVFKGVLANALVCMAVWVSFSARTVFGKVVVIVPPIAAFVAAGFEHSIANMYFIPFALMIKDFAPESFWQTANLAPSSFESLSWLGFIKNVIPVTLGNIIGGGVLVGAVYWFVYLRPRKKSTTQSQEEQ
ncbi:formate transporter FocA [Planctomycetota bacterium]|nr:formate transporter FocA [Planctomycetota bacterium]